VLTLSIVNVELPAVVSTLEILAVEPAAVERHAAMRASVAKSEGFSLHVTTDDERDLEQHGFVQLIAVNTVGAQSAVPEAGEHERIGRLALREIEFGHGNRRWMVDF